MDRHRHAGPLTADYHQYWLKKQRGPVLGTLSADVAEADTELHLKWALALGGLANAQGIEPTSTRPAVGSALVIDAEPMLVSAVAENAITVTRYPTAYGYILIPPGQTHTSGASVSALDIEIVRILDKK